MDELAADAVGAHALRVEGVAFARLVVRVLHFFGNKFMSSMGKLAFFAVGAGLVVLPLAAELRFVLRFVDLRLLPRFGTRREARIEPVMVVLRAFLMIVATMLFRCLTVGGVLGFWRVETVEILAPRLRIRRVIK